MFERFRKEDPQLTLAIEEGFTDLKGHTLETDDAAKVVARLTELHALKPKRVSEDTLVVVSSNVAIAAMLIMFEKHNVITTKMAGFLTKLR